MNGLGQFVTKSYDKTPVKQRKEKMATGKPKPNGSAPRMSKAKPNMAAGKSTMSIKAANGKTIQIPRSGLPAKGFTAAGAKNNTKYMTKEAIATVASLAAGGVGGAALRGGGAALKFLARPAIGAGSKPKALTGRVVPSGTGPKGSAMGPNAQKAQGVNRGKSPKNMTPAEKAAAGRELTRDGVKNNLPKTTANQEKLQKLQSGTSSARSAEAKKAAATRARNKAGKAGAKPSASVGSKLSKSKKYPTTANMEAKYAVKQGQLPKSFSPTNSPKQKTSPIKRKGK